MNGVLDNQTSGNDWGVAVATMPHSSAWDTPRAFPQGQHQSLFEGLEQDMAQSEARDRASIDDVRRFYVLRTNVAVTEFLMSNRSIPHLLLQAVPHLEASFGANTIFALDAPTDEYGWQRLYAVAMWPGKARDAVKALDRFDVAWWIKNSRQASGNLTFTYELVRDGSSVLRLA